MTPLTQQHAAVTLEITMMMGRSLYQAELQSKDYTHTLALTNATRPQGSGGVQDKNIQLHPDGQFVVANLSILVWLLKLVGARSGEAWPGCRKNRARS